MNNLQKCLSDNMKKYRRLQGLSQEKLAERAGASANYIAMIESGKNFPSLPMISQIAKALEIDELDLFNPSEFEYPDLKKLQRRLTAQIQQVIDGNFAKLGSFA